MLEITLSAVNILTIIVTIIYAIKLRKRRKRYHRHNFRLNAKYSIFMLIMTTIDLVIELKLGYVMAAKISFACCAIFVILTIAWIGLIMDSGR